MSDIIDFAIKDLGYTEAYENGHPTNRTKYGSWLGTNGLPWCHAAASYWAWKAGVGTSIVPRTASTDAGMKWFKNKGRFHLKGMYSPQRDDFVYFKTNASHVGVVEYVSNGYLHTIEGNSSQKVARRVYSLNHATITGYGDVHSYINKSSDTYKPVNVGIFGDLAGTNTTGSGTSTKATNTATKPTTSVSNAKSKVKDTKTKIEYDASEELALLKRFLSKLDKSNNILTKSLGKYTLSTYTTQRYKMHVYLIKSESRMWELCVESGLEITQEREGAATECMFKAYKKGIRYSNGDAILIKAGNTTIFYGFIFNIKQSKDLFHQIVAYDQLRYLKNKDTIVFKQKTLTDAIKIIAKKHKLRIGKLASASFKQKLIEDNVSLFEMLDDFSTNELMYKGNQFVIFDEKGKLRLVNMKNMYYPNYYLCWNVCEDVDYESTIDDGFYNKISLIYENDKTGTYEKYEYKDSKSILKYGLLQYTDTIQTPKVGKLKAQALLKYYDKVCRRFTAKGCNGHIKVRAGTIIPVFFELEEIRILNFMIVEKVVYHFTVDGVFTMDLTLKGGEITDAS